jgi:DNA-binding transcriptional regulator YiaG
MEFKDKFKAARLKMMMSQEEIAEKLGVSFATVNRWEAGRNNPNFKAQKAFHALCLENGIKFKDEGEI